MTYLVVKNEDASGVTIPKRQKKTGLHMSIDEVRSGKLYEAKDVDDLMNQLNS